MLIERRPLGGSGIDAPRIALGCGGFGGVGSAPEFFGQGLRDEQAFELMETAWQRGIEWFDTADAYGGGRSETAIGKWIAATGHRPLITTKTYNPIDVGADYGLAPERIHRQIDTSLGRLAVEHVDVYLAHEFDRDTPLEATIEALEQLVEGGKIRSYGVSNFDAAQVEQAARAGRPALVQNSYSLLERGDENELLPLCSELGVAYQAFSPLAGGWLAGKYRRGETYPAGSRMTQRPGAYAHLENERTFRGLDALGRVAEERNVSMAGLALAWALSHPQVTGIVVGPQRSEHLDPVDEALSFQLSPDERDELASFFD